VVLTTGGWDVGLKQIDGKWKMAGPHGFVFWGAAGLVTKADPETGTIFGLHPNGHRDNPIIWRAGMWALTVAPDGPAKSEVTTETTLRLAVARIRGSGPFRRDGAATYGTDAMRVWADHMETTPGFCTECWAGGKGRSWTDAYDNGMRLYKAAQIAARYLRSRQGVAPEARQGLAAAASCYDRVAAALAPSVRKDSPEHYRHWIGKMDKQRAHAGTLRQINGELLMAANHMEQALAVVDKPAVRVRREGKRVWLEGAKEVFLKHFEDSKKGLTTPWAERSDTYMYLAQMRIAGWPVDYADLITVAGYGPSFAYAPGPKDRWGAHYFPPKGRDARIAHATGCQYRWRRYEDVEEYWQALKQAIDEGQAVHGPNEENILFIGYVDAEKPEDRKVMPVAIVFVDEDEWTWEQFAKWHGRQMVNGWFGRIEKRVEPWPARKSALETMATMAEAGMGEDSRQRPDDRVVWGVAGIEAYAKDLADLAKSGAEEDQGGFFQGGWRGCHNVYPQMSGRPAAATYLKRIAPLFEGEARELILAAAAEYSEATKAWEAYTGQLGRECEEVAGVKHSVAWTSETQRKAGATAVAKAAKHERGALVALQKALELTAEN
jgi:hypothetical protein